MSFRRVTPPEAQKLFQEEGYHLLDVRSVPEFEAGHPAGAYNIPLMHKDPATGQMRPNSAFVAEVQARFKVGDGLVVTCESGGRSARAAAVLAEKGFVKLVDNKAGWAGERDMAGRVVTPGWKQAQLPVETGAGGERAYASLPKGAKGGD